MTFRRDYPIIHENLQITLKSQKKAKKFIFNF
jgi:hypothetical protein